jgi:hypothetical protein
MGNEETFGVKQVKQQAVGADKAVQRASFMSGDGTPWENRIVGHGVEDPSQLLANDMNWRTHPAFQRNVVQGALQDIGWISEVIVNKRTGEEWDDIGGRFEETVIDGHLRVLLAMNASQTAVPVKYVDLSPNEEYLALQILDPSAALAHADNDKLEELRSMTDLTALSNDYVKQLLDQLAESHGFLDDISPIDLNSNMPDNLSDNDNNDQHSMYTCPKCGFSFGVKI